MFYRSDDPLRDAMRYDAECQRELDRLPVCCECGGTVQDEYFFEINGEYLCEQCLIENHRRAVEDYVE